MTITKISLNCIIKAWHPPRVQCNKNAKENYFSTFNTSGNIILKMLDHFYLFRTVFQGRKTFDIFKLMNLIFY